MKLLRFYKALLVLINLLCSPFWVYSQSHNQSYIRQVTPGPDGLVCPSATGITSINYSMETPSWCTGTYVNLEWRIFPSQAGSIPGGTFNDAWNVYITCGFSPVTVEWNYAELSNLSNVKLECRAIVGNVGSLNPCPFGGPVNSFCNQTADLDIFTPETPNPGLITDPGEIISNGPVNIDFTYNDAQAGEKFTTWKLVVTSPVGEQQNFGPISILSDFGYVANSFGIYTFNFYINNGCSGDPFGPYTKSVNVRASCTPPDQQDPNNPKNTYALLSVSGVPGTNNRYEVDPGVTYNLILNTDIIDFDAHYTLTSPDAGGLLTLDPVNMTFSTSATLASFNIGYAKNNPGRGSCPSATPITITVGGSDQTVQQTCPVVVPDDLDSFNGVDLDPNDPVLEVFALTVKSQKGIVVKPGLTLVSGAELFLEAGTPQPVTDLDKNFIQSNGYNEFGELLSSSRQYFDKQGRLIQTQYSDLDRNTILADATLYDAYGRAVINTLNAPVWAGNPTTVDPQCETVLPGDGLQFQFKDNFVSTGTGSAYSYTNFDLTKESTPDKVGKSTVGTLGWYYGDQNGNATGDQAIFNEPLTAQTGYPFSRTLFHHDGTEEPKSVSRPGDEFIPSKGHLAIADRGPVADGDTYLTDYFAMRSAEMGLTAGTAYAGNYFKTVNLDEHGRKSEIYLDQEENPLITLYFGDQATPITKSYQLYDDVGRLIYSISPNGVAQYNGSNFAAIDKTRYQYNYKGFLTEMEETDAGLTKYLYARDGRIRFSENAEQRFGCRTEIPPGEQDRACFSYTNYDDLRRPVESGEYLPNAGGIQFDSPEMLAILESTAADGGLPDAQGTKTDQTITHYDLAVNPAGRVQRFVQGNVSYTQGDDGITTYYSYDEQGRVEWMVQDITGLGIKTIDYQYSEDGNVSIVAYQKDDLNEDFYHYYTYDLDGRLKTVHAGTEAPEFDLDRNLINLDLQATYHYYLHGPLKRVELAGDLQGIDYVYTADGMLKGINHGELSSDPGGDGTANGFRSDLFGQTLHYFPQDYKGADQSFSTNYPAQYNGNIRAQNWHSPVDGHSTKTYAYNYDERYQLSQAHYGTGGLATAFAKDNTNKYEENVPLYDANGNIRSLSRKGDTGNALADFTYNYVGNTNKLDNIQHQGAAFRNYGYDAIGQITSQIEGANAMHLDYDVTGKVVGIYNSYDATSKTYSGPQVTFKYDDRGFRLSKTNYDAAGTATQRTWYVRDASGSVMSIYQENIATSSSSQLEIPIYGSGRIALYKPGSSTIFYELTDHLGNVRAVIGRTAPVNFLATSEVMPAAEEQLYFTHLEESRATVPQYINHTPGVESSKAIRLNNYRTRKERSIGAAISLKVRAGDTLRSEVFVKYLKIQPDPSPDIKALLLALPVSTAVSPGAIDQLAARSATGAESLLPIPLNGEKSVETTPRAYLNYILYDSKMQVVDAGYVRVTEAAEIPDTHPHSHEHERLAQEVVATQPGYAYFYVSSESRKDVEVFFDDFAVTQVVSDIVVAHDYYPYGLPLPGREITEESYRFGFQGEFSEEDEETGWNSFELRMYDPVVGRWTTTDPAGQYWSPYMSMGNDPINQVDPDGAFSKFGAWWRSGFRGSRIYESGGEWGFNRGTGEYTWESIMVNGQEQFVRTEIVEFRVGQFGEGSTVPLLTAYEPNFAGRIKGFVDNSSGPINFFGGIGYDIADNAYISFFQLGGERRNLEGFGVNRNEVTDAGVNTLTTLNPIGRTSSTLFKGINIASFNKYFKGSFIARLQPQWKGYILRTYNSWVHKGRIKTTMTAVGAGAKATDAALNDD